MDEDKIIVTHREQSYIERYIDGEISKMFKHITAAYDKYKDSEKEDIYIKYIKAFFTDDAKLTMEHKQQIRKLMKQRKSK